MREEAYQSDGEYRFSLPPRELLEQAEKAAGFGTWELDVKGDRWSVSEHWMKIHGRNHAPNTTADVLEIVHPDDREEFLNALSTAQSEGRAFRTRHRTVVPASGKIRWIEITGDCTTPHGSESLYLHGVSRDVTEQAETEHALKASEEKFRLTAENSLDDIWQLDTEGHVTYVSPAVRKIFGYSQEEALTLDFTVFFQEKELPKAAEAFEKALSGTQRQLIEFDAVRKDGSIVPIEVSVAPIFKDDLIAGVQGIARDISERKLMERSILRSETRFRLFMENFPGMAIITDENGKTVYINHRYLALTGKSADEVIGKPMEKLLEGASLQRAKHENETVIQQNEALFFKNVFPSSQGPIHLHTYRFPIPLPDESVLIGSISLDVTEQVAMENRLKKLNADLQAVIDNTDEFILISDGNAKPILFNSAYAQMMKDMLGLEMKPGIQPHTYLENKELKTWWDNLHERVLGGERFVEEFPYDIGNNTIRHFEVRYNPIIEEGEVTGFTEFTRDITDRKVGERKLIEANRQLKKNQLAAVNLMHDLSEEIVERTRVEEALKKALAEQKTLNEEIHHRVKNNLQIISSMLNLQSSKLNNQAAEEAFQAARSRILSMALVHEQLYQSRSFSQIGFSTYVNDMMMTFFQSSFMDHHIEVKLELEDFNLSIDQAVPAGLILNELITNALKYAFNGRTTGTVTVATMCEEDRIILQVDDDGVGLSHEIDLEQVETFGLRLLSILTEQLNGTIDLKTDNGTSFTVTFPVKDLSQQ